MSFVKTSIEKFLNFFKSNPLNLLILVFIVIILSSGAFVANQQLKKEQKAQSDKTATKSANRTTAISVQSEPAGIIMKGEPYCDATKLGKQTPYECELPAGVKETKITAPSEVQVGGQTYIFETWNGCSESNIDKKICKKTIIDNSSSQEIKAIYSKKTASTASQNKPNETQSDEPCSNPGNDGTYYYCTIQVTEVPKKILISHKIIGQAATSEFYQSGEVGCLKTGECTYGDYGTGGIIVNKPIAVVIPASVEAFDQHCGTGSIKCVYYSRYLFKNFAVQLPQGSDYRVEMVYEFSCITQLDIPKCK